MHIVSSRELLFPTLMTKYTLRPLKDVSYLVRTSTLYKRACKEVASAAIAAISSRAAVTVSA